MCYQHPVPLNQRRRYKILAGIFHAILSYEPSSFSYRAPLAVLVEKRRILEKMWTDHVEVFRLMHDSACIAYSRARIRTILHAGTRRFSHGLSATDGIVKETISANSLFGPSVWSRHHLSCSRHGDESRNLLPTSILHECHWEPYANTSDMCAEQTNKV